MKNNLQADSLKNIYSFKFSKYIESEAIELDKKSFKGIKIGSWLRIDTTEIKAGFIDKNRVIANVKLFPNGDYLYAEIKAKKSSKKNKTISSKKSFTLKIKSNLTLQNGVFVLEKLPVVATILRENREFAYANVFFNGSFVLEVKELLWKKY